MAVRPDDFMFGISKWLRGDEDSLDADAAAHLLGETILLHRKWLLSKIRK